MLISSAGDILNASAKGWEGGSDNDKVSTWGRGSLNQFSPKMSTALCDRSPMSNCQAKTFVDRLICSWRGKRQVELKSCFTLTSILDKRETWSNVVLNSKVATPAARYFFKVSMILLASASLSSCGEEHKGKTLFFLQTKHIHSTIFPTKLEYTLERLAPFVKVQPQADHALFVWQLLLLKSGYWSFVLNRQNTDEHYGVYNLLQQQLPHEQRVVCLWFNVVVLTKYSVYEYWIY